MEENKITSLLVADEDLRCRIFADEHDRQAELHAVAGLELFADCLDLLSDFAGGRFEQR